MKRRSLCGSSQDRCRCAASPGGEAQEAEDHVLHAVAHVATRRRRGTRWAPRRPGRSTTDTSCAPSDQSAFSSARSLPRFTPVAVDVVDVAELARVHQLLQPHQARVVLEQVADHQRPAALRAPRPPPPRRRPPTAPAASPRTRACPPRGRAGPARRGWARAWRSPARRGRGRRAARRTTRWCRAPGERRARRSSALAVAVAEPGQRAIRQRAEVAGQVRPPVAEAHHSDRDGHAAALAPQASTTAAACSASAPGPSAGPGSSEPARRSPGSSRPANSRIGAWR